MWNLAESESRGVVRAPNRGPGPRGALAGLLALVATAASHGCAGSEITSSAWPGDGFRIVMRGGQLDEFASLDSHDLRIWPDGFVLYRIASAHLPDTDLPVFDTVAAWQLRTESMRMLSRRLRDAGLFDDSTRESQATEPNTGERFLVIDWWRNGESGQLSTAHAAGDAMERVTHVLNAFLPQDAPLPWPSGPLSGDPEPRRLDELPELRTDAASALEYHLSLVRGPARGDLERADRRLLQDLFALAATLEDWPTARDALLTASNLPATPGEEDRAVLESLAERIPAAFRPRFESDSR